MTTQIVSEFILPPLAKIVEEFLVGDKRYNAVMKEMMETIKHEFHEVPLITQVKGNSAKAMHFRSMQQEGFLSLSDLSRAIPSSHAVYSMGISRHVILYHRFPMYQTCYHYTFGYLRISSHFI